MMKCRHFVLLLPLILVGCGYAKIQEQQHLVDNLRARCLASGDQQICEVYFAELGALTASKLDMERAQQDFGATLQGWGAYQANQAQQWQQQMPKSYTTTCNDFGNTMSCTTQ